MFNYKSAHETALMNVIIGISPALVRSTDQFLLNACVCPVYSLITRSIVNQSRPIKTKAKRTRKNCSRRSRKKTCVCVLSFFLVRPFFSPLYPASGCLLTWQKERGVHTRTDGRLKGGLTPGRCTRPNDLHWVVSRPHKSAVGALTRSRSPPHTPQYTRRCTVICRWIVCFDPAKAAPTTRCLNIITCRRMCFRFFF